MNNKFQLFLINAGKRIKAFLKEAFILFVKAWILAVIFVSLQAGYTLWKAGTICDTMNSISEECMDYKVDYTAIKMNNDAVLKVPSKILNNVFFIEDMYAHAVRITN